MVTPASGGTINPLVLAAAKRAGVTRDLSHRRRAGRRGAGLWHGDALRRSTRSSAPAMPMSPPPSARCSARSASIPSPGHRKSWSSATAPTIRTGSPPICSRQAEHDRVVAEHSHHRRCRVRRQGRGRRRARAGDSAAPRDRARKLARLSAPSSSWRGSTTRPRSSIASRRSIWRSRPPIRKRLLARVRHAGAIFLGRHTPEAMGDYIAGPNHVLPTSRTARFSSGLSVLDFMKRTTLAVLRRARRLASARPRRHRRSPRPKASMRMRAPSRRG